MWNTGSVQKVVLAVTFVLTLIIAPAVRGAGRGRSVRGPLRGRQSNRVTIKRWILDPDGNLIEERPPRPAPERGGHPPTVRQPVFRRPRGVRIPTPRPGRTPRDARWSSSACGHTDLGTTFMQVLKRYAWPWPPSTASSSSSRPSSASRTSYGHRRHRHHRRRQHLHRRQSGRGRPQTRLRDATAWIEDQQRNGHPDPRGDDKPG